MSPWTTDRRQGPSPPYGGRQMVATGVSPWKTDRQKAQPAVRRAAHVQHGRQTDPQELEESMGHTFTKHLYHVVFSTKERRPYLETGVRARLLGYLGGIARNLGTRLLAANARPDHIHLLVAIGPETPVSKLVGVLKANSSKWLSSTFPELRPFAWQAGYASFTVSESSRPHVVRYIEDQEEHHRRFPFADELAALLQRHGVSFDGSHYLG